MFAALGWFAVIVYICAQAYVSFVSHFRRGVFYSLNAVAAVALAVASAAILSWQAVAVNVFWAGVSVLGLRYTKWPNVLRVRPRVVFWLISAVTFSGLVGVANGALVRGFDLLGWAGTLLYCGIYLLFAAQRLGRRRYLLLNVAASALLMPIYYLDGNIPSLTLNVFWAGISFAGVFAIAVRGRAPESGAVPGEPPLRQLDRAGSCDGAGDAPPVLHDTNSTP